MNNHGMTWGLTYWPIALIAASAVLAGLFFPAEILALTTNHGNTLTDFARYELDLRTALGQRTRLHTLAWWSSLIVWLMIVPGMVIWLTGHIWFVRWG